MAQFEWKFEWRSVRGTCRSGGAFNLGRRLREESHSLRNSWKTICFSTRSVRKGFRPSRVVNDNTGPVGVGGNKAL